MTGRDDAATVAHERLYRSARSFYTALVIERKPSRKRLALLLYTASTCFLFNASRGLAAAQQAQQKPPAEPAAKSTEKPDKPEKAGHPAQIELLETKVRFETNGDSRKEVHALVKINSELGVRQFAQLNFDFNRSFESVEIPMAHITHANVGTSDILPSAVTDHPNPAVVNAPAYQDVRVKSVRILGLQPGDTLEYRVVRTVSHHPLAPDFWLEHSFDRTGVVTHEIFEIDLPASRHAQIQINPATPVGSTQTSGEGESSRTISRWDIGANSNLESAAGAPKDAAEPEPDVAVSTIDWLVLSIHLDENLTPGAKRLETIADYEESMKESARRYRDIDPDVAAKANELTKASHSLRAMAEPLYDFVSRKIATIDLPLGATGFIGRPAKEILTSGYATQEDKFVLFAALAAAAKFGAEAGLTGYCNEKGLAWPTRFTHLLMRVSDTNGHLFWTDPSLGVAPFGMVSPIPQKCIFVLNRGFFALNSKGHEWQPFDRKLPFDARQTVTVDASLSVEGKLAVKARYLMRGDNELVLREAFHKTPKERWKEVAQLLSLTDGFRGQVTGVNASDPYATMEPFVVEYELEQAKFVDWSKKPVRIPALLPQLGLPDPPAKPAAGSATAPIELGTPLEVETRMTLHLPPGATASAPTGTSVERDYATYTSQYSVNGSTIAASRHIQFILREVPAARAADYNAFLRAVQNDETQDFTLERHDSSAPKTNSPAPNATAPPKTVAPKP